MRSWGNDTEKMAKFLLGASGRARNVMIPVEMLRSDWFLSGVVVAILTRGSEWRLSGSRQMAAALAWVVLRSVLPPSHWLQRVTPGGMYI